MASERIQRQTDRLLDEAERAMAERNWPAVRESTLDALALDADNADAEPSSQPPTSASATRPVRTTRNP